ncbi:MAG: hypothetical protein ABJA67_00515 [Chthonomonadales bacterium]
MLMQLGICLGIVLSIPAYSQDSKPAPEVTAKTIPSPPVTGELTIQQELKNLSPFATIAGQRMDARALMMLGQANARTQRITIDLNNVEFIQGVKATFAAAKQDFDLDSDLPKNLQLNIRLTNVPLFTALDAITQPAGVSWTREVRVGKDSPPKIVYRVGKTVGNSSMVLFTSNSHLPSEKMQAIQISSGSTAYGISDPMDVKKIVSVLLPEDRMVFNCPHCHGKVATYKETYDTVSKAGNVNYRWKFCPLCGKPISLSSTRSSRRVLPPTPVEPGIDQPIRSKNRRSP